ncbi:hypothetical protein OQA88_11533 [Cercophora sp. LCS_1]
MDVNGKFVFIDGEMADGSLISNATSIKSELAIHRNKGLRRASFPELEWSESVEIMRNAYLDLSTSLPTALGVFRGLARLDLPMLKKTNTSTVSPFRSLENWAHSINGSLTIPDIHGDLAIKNNTALQNFTTNVLRSVHSIEMVGSFTNVEFFSLEEVTGDFYLEGTASMDCTWFNDKFPDKVVKGKYNCIGNTTYPATPRRPGTPTTLPELEPSGIPGDGTSPGGEVGGLALIGLGAWVFVFMRRRKPADPPSAEEVGKPELGGEEKNPEAGDTVAENQAPTELRTDQERKVGELPVGDESDLEKTDRVGSRKKGPVELP